MYEDRWTIDRLRKSLVLPVIVSPMFLVSGKELAVASSRAGVLGTYPLANSRTIADCDQALGFIAENLAADKRADGTSAPFGVNLVVHRTNARFDEELALVEKYKPAVVISCFGDPSRALETVHDYGGLVFHDVATRAQAERAVKSGVDGLILLTAGAGGHTGSLNPFSFVSEVRSFWDGPIILAGGMSDGRAVYAATVLGADFAYMGTRFAATEESIASDAYKQLLVSQTSSDVVVTERISGVPATFMRGSLKAVGLDPDDLPPIKAPLQPNLPRGLKAWKDIWSGGHGIGTIDDIPSVAQLVNRLSTQYVKAAGQRTTD